MNPRDFSERALLGHMLSNPGEIRALRPILTATDFYRAPHQQVWTAIDALVAEHDQAHPSAPHEQTVPGVDALTVWQRLQDTAEHGVRHHPGLAAAGLHTLMETAPPAPAAQPRAYALMVLESSVRRQVKETGMRIGHVAETSPDLDSLLAQVDQALAGVDEAQQRWETALHGPEEAQAAGDARASRVVLADAEAVRPDPEAIERAEYALMEGALTTPGLLDDPRGAAIVEPADFADPQLGAAWRAAVTVHSEQATTGVAIDAVTVAWAQQRLAPQHGDGLDSDQLAQMGRNVSLGSAAVHNAAETVLRGSVQRMTAAAAHSVHEAAMHPGMAPSDVLHTSHQVLEAVNVSARRISPAAALAGQATPTHQAAPPGPTSRAAEQPAHQAQDSAQISTSGRLATQVARDLHHRGR